MSEERDTTKRGRPKGARYDATLIVRIGEQDRDALDVLAGRLDVSRSEAARIAIRHALPSLLRRQDAAE